MFKRAGVVAPISLVIAMVALLALSAGAVSAKPWKTVTITRTSACHYTVWYAWTSMGHGSDLTAGVQVGAYDADGNSHTVGAVSAPHKSGADGIFSNDFVITGQSQPFQFKGYGFLAIPSKSQVIAKSEAYSATMVPQAPELCP